MDSIAFLIFELNYSSKPWNWVKGSLYYNSRLGDRWGLLVWETCGYEISSALGFLIIESYGGEIFGVLTLNWYLPLLAIHFLWACKIIHEAL